MAEPASYRYDVFISYHPRDGDWVWDWLLPRLEQAGLRVCIDQKCFQPGAPVATEIERAVNESRRTLAVMTPAWVESQWDQFEALLIHQKDAAARIRRLIPLLLKPCYPPDRIRLLQWVDFTDAGRQEEQLSRVIDDIKGVSALPELRRDVFPEPKQRRWELRWFAVAGIAAVLTLVVLVGWIWWQNRKPTRMPDGGFNIAVAPLSMLSESGRPLSIKEGAAWANQIADFLDTKTNSLESGVPLVVRTWGPQRLAFPRFNEKGADEAAQRLNATVLIYGKLKKTGPQQWQLEPKLHFSESAVKELAPELQGDYAFGRPIPFFDDSSGKGDVNQALQRRLEALAPLFLGIQQYGHGDSASYEKAVTYFEKASASSWGQSQNEGQEILFIFLGSGYTKYASWAVSRDEKLYIELLHKAESAFQRAIQIDPEYARAYNGLGYTQMGLAAPPVFVPSLDKVCNLVGFDSAYQSHQRAMQAENQPTVVDMVRFDAELGMARVRLKQAIECGDPEPLKSAKDHFHAAINIIKNNEFIEQDRKFNAIIAYGEFGRLYLYVAQYALYDPNFTDKSVTSLIDESMLYLEQAISLGEKSSSEEIVRYLESVRKLWAYGKCVRERDASLDAFKECNQQ